jgi:hypothetical protein
MWAPVPFVLKKRNVGPCPIPFILKKRNVINGFGDGRLAKQNILMQNMKT